ncbi:WD40-repeat-containing domain protein [Lipomyces kononenkoae]
MQYQSTIQTHPSLARDQAGGFFRTQRTREYREQVGPVTPRGGGGAAAGSPSSSSIVRTIAWNALGNRIAAVSSLPIHGGSGGGTHIIRIWNPERADARYSTELKGHTGAIDCVAWDPTLSDRLVSCSSADGTVRLWDARLNRTLQMFRAGTTVGIEPVFVRFTPDGRWIIMCGVRARILVVLNAGTLQVAAGDGIFTDLRPQDGDITRAIVTFSGDVVAIGYSSGIVKLHSFDSSTGEIGRDALVSLNAHRTSITCLEFDPWGKYMALGSNDSLVSIWDVQELVCVRTFAKFSQAVKCISISFDGAYMAISVEGVEPIEIVHVETGECLYSVPRSSPFHVPALEWHPTKYWLAYAGDPGGLKILGTPDYKR